MSGSSWRLAALMSSVVSLVMGAHLAEVAIWALTYELVGGAPRETDRLYFAFVNYNRPCDAGLLENGTAEGRDGERLAATRWGRAVLPELLYALPMSGASPDAGCKLKVVGSDVLDATAREQQLQALLDHWRDLAAQWRQAEHHCPGRQPSVCGWMQHNIDLARAEIEWLTTARG